MTSVAVKSELEAEHGLDSTALNAVRGRCSDGTYVSSSEGAWGSWSAFVSCPTGGFITGFALMVQQVQVGGDTAANRIRAMCQDGSYIEPAALTSLGAWTGYAICPSGTAACGMRGTPPRAGRPVRRGQRAF